jgi:protein TonB
MSASLAESRPPAPTVTSRRRWSGIIFVILFHIVAIYALASGMAKSTVELLKGPLEAAVVEEIVDDDKPPPPPPPDFKPPPPVVAPPEITIDLTTATAPTSTISTTTKPVAVAQPTTRPRPGRNNTTTEADYPPISRRLNEEGTTLLKLTINTEGRAENVTVSKSSGFPRLDEASVQIVTNRFRWTPAQAEGKPVAVEQQIQVKWQLR